MMTSVTKSFFSKGQHVLLDGYIKRRRFIPHGEVRVTNDKGARILLGQYLHGRPNGKWSRWYENGNLSSSHDYVFGQLSGTSRQYWENGELARECTYQKGMHDYEAKTYTKKGKEEKHLVYKKGRLSRAKIIRQGKHLDYDADLLRLKFPWVSIAEKLCYLDQNNRLRCKTPFQMWRDLNTIVSPEVVEGILRQFDDIYSQLGLDSKKKVLTACGGTFVATAVDDSAPAVSASDEHNASISQHEADSIEGACRAAVQDAVIADSGFDLNNRQRTRDVVNSIDEAVTNCVDDDNSMIALGPGAVVASCLAAPEICAVILGGIGAASAAVISYVWDDGWSEDVEVRPGVYESNNGSGTTRTRDENTDQTIIDQPGTPQDGNQGGRTVTTTSSDGTSSTEYYDKDGNLIRVVNRDENGNVTFDSDQDMMPEEDSTTGDDSAEFEIGEPTVTPGGRGGSGTPSAGQPVDENSMSRCESLAAWWAMKKAYCEQSNWQSYDCQEIIRVFSGCADPALVYPTPDGSGVVCPQEGSMTPEEWRQKECERKSMIMIPSGFGSELCISRGNVTMPERDICTDPRAQCVPDMMVPDEIFESQYRFINTRRGAMNPLRMSRQTGSTLAPELQSYPAVKKVEEEFFRDRIESKSESTHFVVFASKSCGPCHKVLNVFNDVAGNYKGATFNWLDVSQNPSLTERFNVKYTPTILVFKNGSMIGQRRVGAASREVLIEYIDRAFQIQGEVAPVNPNIQDLSPKDTANKEQ